MALAPQNVSLMQHGISRRLACTSSMYERRIEESQSITLLPTLLLPHLFRTCKALGCTPRTVDFNNNVHSLLGWHFSAIEAIGR